MTTPSPHATRRSYATLFHPGDGIPCPGNPGFVEWIATEELCPAGSIYQTGPVPYLLLSLTLGGRARLESGKNTYPYEPGNLIVAAIDTPLDREEVGSKRDWRVCYLMLRGVWAEQISRYLTEKFDPPITVLPRIAPHPHHLFLSVFELITAQPTGWQWLLISRAAELVSEIFRAMREAAPEDPFLVAVRQCLQNDARVSVPQLAAHFKQTPRQFIYRFRKLTSEAPAGWIRRRRIDAAYRLLGQGLSVTEVAEQLGFSNPYHFSRMFKNVLGVSPSSVAGGTRLLRRHTPTNDGRDTAQKASSGTV